MNTKIKFLVVFGIVTVVVGAFFLMQSATPQDTVVQVPETDPLDVVLDFYGDWLELSASSSDRYISDLFKAGALTAGLQAQINTTREASPELDPLTCQSGLVPERVRGRIFPASETEVKILVESRVGRDTLPQMAFVTVMAVSGEWKMTEVECTAGDVAPEVEFNYDRQGFLLKSVPPPFESGKWHLVFEQDGQMGHVTPLFFSATTSCVSTAGESSVCNPDTFSEASQVVVKGSMTEIGADVIRLEFQ